MILRSVIKHVRDQNWFAVGIDFLIVVVGVFIGIQVSNWNDEAGRLAKEQTYLALVHEELMQISRSGEKLQEYYSTVTEAGERALVYLEGDTECRTACEGLLIDFFHASQLWAISLDRTAYEKAAKLSFPTDNALREELFTTYNVSAENVSMELEIDSLEIDIDTMIPLGLILNELISNSLKHAFQSNSDINQIDIQFEINNKFLNISIKDNGIGYNQTQKDKISSNHKSVALKITKERIEHLTKYNSFNIEEIKDKNEIKGTLVSFKIPLKTDF